MVELRVEVFERVRGIEVARGEQRLVGITKLMQARLIRVVGLRVAEPLVLYNYEGGPNAKVTNTGRTTSPK